MKLWKDLERLKMAKIITKQEVLNRFTTVHGTKYDYSKVEYIDAKTKVIIICPKHGEFKVSPSKHYGRGHGCPQCVGRSGVKLDQASFSERALNVHMGKYDYSLVALPKSKSKVVIICKNHGPFEQRVDQHLGGAGCPACTAANKPISEKVDNFIERSIAIHNNKYDYSKVKFVNTETNVTIICPIHGEFEQTPYSHLNRERGCHICARRNTGFRPEGSAILYYLRIDTDDGPLYKIGITGKTVAERYSPSELSKITVLFTVNYEVGRCARDEEQKILKDNEMFLYTGKKVLFSGNTELFTRDVLEKDIKVATK